jgi:hypothetical protein
MNVQLVSTNKTTLSIKIIIILFFRLNIIFSKFFESSIYNQRFNPFKWKSLFKVEKAVFSFEFESKDI